MTRQVTGVIEEEAPGRWRVYISEFGGISIPMNDPERMSDLRDRINTVVRPNIKPPTEYETIVALQWRVPRSTNDLDGGL